MVIAYLRISTGKQHIANQQDEIMRFALSKDLEIHKWVTEVVSGKKAKKERKLGKTLRRLKQGDILIVTELSRLSRTLTEIMSIVGECLERKITIYSTKDGYAFDDSINSKVLCFAFGLVAEIERNSSPCEPKRLSHSAVPKASNSDAAKEVVRNCKS